MDYNCDSYIIQSMIIYKIVKTFVGLFITTTFSGNVFFKQKTNNYL